MIFKHGQKSHLETSEIAAGRNIKLFIATQRF